MEEVIGVITKFTVDMGSVSDGMKGIFAALVALGLLGLLFSRLGK